MRYWVYKDSEIIGPVSQEERDRWREMGSDVMVSPEDGGSQEFDWKSATEIPELADYVQAPSLDALLRASMELAPGVELESEIGTSAPDWKGWLKELTSLRESALEAEKWRTADLETRVYELSAKLGQYDIQQNQILERLSQKDQQLTKKERQLTEQGKLLVEKERLLAEKDGLLAAVRGEALQVEKLREAELEIRLAELTAKLQQFEVQQNRIQEILSHKDRLLTEKERQLTEQTGLLVEKDRLLAEKDSLAAGKDRLLETKEHLIRSLSGAIAAAAAVPVLPPLPVIPQVPVSAPQPTAPPIFASSPPPVLLPPVVPAEEAPAPAAAAPAFAPPPAPSLSPIVPPAPPQFYIPPAALARSLFQPPESKSFVPPMPPVVSAAEPPAAVEASTSLPPIPAFTPSPTPAPAWPEPGAAHAPEGSWPQESPAAPQPSVEAPRTMVGLGASTSEAASPVFPAKAAAESHKAADVSFESLKETPVPTAAPSASLVRSPVPTGTKPRSKMAPIFAGVICLIGLVGAFVVFFRGNPGDMAQMVSMRPKLQQATTAAAVPAQEQPAPAAPVQGAVPPVVSGAPASGAVGSGVGFPGQTQPQGVQPTAPSAPPVASAPKSPADAAIEIVKGHVLDGNRGTIEQWLKYSFPITQGQEKWTAGIKDENTYFVGYRLLKGGQTSGNGSDGISYIFQVDLTKKTVEGVNQPAVELLKPEMTQEIVAAPVVHEKPAKPKRVVVRAPRKKPSDQFSQMALPSDADLRAIESKSRKAVGNDSSDAAWVGAGDDSLNP